MAVRAAIVGVLMSAGCAWSPRPYAADPLLRTGAAPGDPSRTLPVPTAPPRPPDPPATGQQS